MKKRGVVTILSRIRLGSENICQSRLAYGSWGCLLEARGAVSRAQRLCLPRGGFASRPKAQLRGTHRGERLAKPSVSYTHTGTNPCCLPWKPLGKDQFPSPPLCPGGIPGCSPGNGNWAPSPGSPVPTTTWDKSLPAFVGG